MPVLGGEVCGCSSLSFPLDCVPVHDRPYATNKGGCFSERWLATEESSREGGGNVGGGMIWDAEKEIKERKILRRAFRAPSFWE